MTLYELTNDLTMQGNIKITIYDQDGNEKEVRRFTDQGDFTTYNADAYDLDDLEVAYIWPTYEQGEAWINIELTEDED
jgi:hypothetical protein